MLALSKYGPPPPKDIWSFPLDEDLPIRSSLMSLSRAHDTASRSFCLELDVRGNELRRVTDYLSRNLDRRV